MTRSICSLGLLKGKFLQLMGQAKRGLKVIVRRFNLGACNTGRWDGDAIVRLLPRLSSPLPLGG